MVLPDAHKHVLVVDDDRAVLALVTGWLKVAGYEVRPCDCFEDAKHVLTTTVPSVLLADVRLGAFNGLQLVILAKERNALTVPIVMSAFDDPALRREAAYCGATYLSKPFSREQVLAAVEAAMVGPVRDLTL
jgi:DNA-binding NtrC family response regulator